VEIVTLLWQVRDGSGFVYTVLAYLVPLLLYCAWSALVFLELAWNEASPAEVWRWSAATLLLPLLGPALFLLAGPSRLTRATRLAIVWGGALLVVGGYLLIYFVLR